MFYTLVVLFLWFKSIGAQRPDNASICDYYAQITYGTNTSTTQLLLVKHIMSLAFAGKGNLTNITVSDTFVGIMQPNNNTDLNLRKYFNGSLSVTNVYGSPGAINWLDGNKTAGSDPLAPLHDYLEGRASDVIFPASSNAYLLFDHFFVAFAKLFGCTVPGYWAIGQALTKPPNPAFVHKYMNLTQLQLNHFINQVTDASIAFGFSAQDARSLNDTWNNKFNQRCLPRAPFALGAQPQLLSLCQNPSCPLPIDGTANCALYSNLTQSDAGIDPLATIPINVVPATLTTSPSATVTVSSISTPTAPAGSSSSSLSTGAIAGIVVGITALSSVIALVLFSARRRKRKTANEATLAQQTQSSSRHSPPEMMDTSTLGSAMNSPDANKTHFSFTSNPSDYVRGHRRADSSSPPTDTTVSNRFTYYDHEQLEPAGPEHNRIPVELGHD